MSRVRRSITFAHRVERRLAAESFDVIHAISPCHGVDIYQPRGGTVAETIERNIALRRTGAGRALKRWANLLNLKQRYMLRFEQRLLGGEHAPIVAAVSHYVIRQLQHHYSLPADRTRLIYNGITRRDTPPDEASQVRSSIRHEFGVRQDQILVLLIAHNFRLKGLARWMESLAGLVGQGETRIRSLVIGRGDTRRWHRRAASLGISKFLTFTGPSDRIAAFHLAADVLVHPTFYDPCSRVVLEAMSAGLACVTTRWDGASEVIEDGKNGFVLDDPWDTAALGDRMRRLLDADVRERMGTAARQVADRVSMARHVEEMTALYEEVASGKKPRHRA